MREQAGIVPEEHEMQELSELNDTEKKEIALGAAMGAGCRTCAENLQRMLVSEGVTSGELEAVCTEGLAVRDEATATMRRKVGELLGQSSGPEPGPKGSTPSRLGGLVRVAAAVAANSSPDALHHLGEAAGAGASDADIAVALQIARAVRTKAQGFSDAELDQAEERPAASADSGACCAPGSATADERTGQADCL
jgi:hypothetical protein